MINFNIEAPGSNIEEKKNVIANMLPLGEEKTIKKSEIESMMGMLEALQTDLRQKADIKENELKQQIQLDLAKKDSELRQAYDKERRAEANRQQRSILRSNNTNQSIGSKFGSFHESSRSPPQKTSPQRVMSNVSGGMKAAAPVKQNPSVLLNNQYNSFL